MGVPVSRPPSVHTQLYPLPLPTSQGPPLRGRNAHHRRLEDWPQAHAVLGNAVWLRQVECCRWHNSSALRTPHPVGRASDRAGPTKGRALFPGLRQQPKAQPKLLLHPWFSAGWCFLLEVSWQRLGRYSVAAPGGPGCYCHRARRGQPCP